MTAGGGALAEQVSGERFRRVLGQYPTGVVVVTALVPGQSPVALTIGSFSSVSLDPPLVAFYPGLGSTTWPKIQQQGRFCINILSASQETLCRSFQSKSANKFDGVAWHSAPHSGAPIIDGAVAWIDCDLDQVQILGDHYLAVARVTALDTESQDLPLLFFRGGYGRFLPTSLATADVSLAGFLPLIETVRPELENISESCQSECLLAATVRDEFVVLAGAGARSTSSPDRSRVGRRLPYLAPLGIPMAAWGNPEDIKRWIYPEAGPDSVDSWTQLIQLTRKRGYVVGRGNLPYAELERAIEGRAEKVWDADVMTALEAIRATVLDQPSLDETGGSYDVRSLLVPIFLPGGAVAQIGLYGLDAEMDAVTIRRYSDRLLEASWKCSQLLGGEMPDDFPRPGSVE
jgi:flavin reductase (DIM6/NTAB) family NADH-FMN oxidoreductase RutF/DNA-binding IclR family transcriptional regulator